MDRSALGRRPAGVLWVLAAGSLIFALASLALPFLPASARSQFAPAALAADPTPGPPPGDEETSPPPAGRPVPLSGVVDASIGQWHACAVTADGTLRCWGDNSMGGLGDGTTDDRLLPVEVVGLPGRILDVEVGYRFTCALTEGGGLWCWGANEFGQLGDGTANDRAVPAPVAGLERGVRAFAIGSVAIQSHGCALVDSGEVRCWGDNGGGQLGDGTRTSRPSPVTVRGLGGRVEAIGASAEISCALLEGGALECWGGDAEAGAGDYEPHPTPVAVVGLASGVVQVAGGFQHACALTRDGGVRCWGYNAYGQLGDGTRRSANRPVEVVGLPAKAVSISLGEGETSAVLEDGSVYAWGAGFSVTVANAETVENPRPVRVGGLPAIRSVDLGEYGGHLDLGGGCAIDRGGGLWCWGDNDHGQLGDGTLIHRRTPVQVVGSFWTGYRPTGPLVPELTTYIPTPLDVSTDPAVVGTNLLLAALVAVLLTLSSKLMTRMLAEHEAAIGRRLAVVRGLARLEARADAALAGRIRHPLVADALRLGAVVVFYGLVFSFLERDWQPLTVTGLYLLLSMTVACGLAGIADDIAQWRVARRWGLPAVLAVRPTNILLAAASTAVSRGFAVVPGLMFGSPEALQLDDEAVDERRGRRLSAIGLGTLVAIGVGAWAVTAGAELARRAGVGDAGLVALGGLESLLLIVFAVTVQNLFVQMLGLPGSGGRLLRTWNVWAWFATFVAVTFLFWHTLLNPVGDVTEALQTRNVQVTAALVGGFTLLTAATWLGFRVAAWRTARRTRMVEAPAPPAVSRAGVAVAAGAEPRPRTVEDVVAERTASVSHAPVPPWVAPVGSAPIAATATGAAAVVTVGYCAACHAVAAATGDDRCATCGGSLIDIRTETRAAGAPAVAAAAPPAVAARLAVAAPLVAATGVEFTLRAQERAGFVGRPRFRVTGGTVTVVAERLDRTADRRYRLFALVGALVVLLPAIAFVFVAEPGDLRRIPGAVYGGYAGLFGAWLIALVIADAWRRRQRNLVAVSFPAIAVADIHTGRDWARGCLLMIFLTPLIGLLVILFAGRKIVHIRAPFEPGSTRLEAHELRAESADEAAAFVQAVLLARAAV